MEPALGILLLPGLIMMGISFSLVVLAFSAYFRIKGIERACWAIVSQLRAARLEKTPDLDPAATRRAVEIADASGHVKFSMFGR